MTKHPVYWSIAQVQEDEGKLNPLGYAATKHEAIRLGQQKKGVVFNPWLKDINRGEAGVVQCWILSPTRAGLRPHGWRE